MEGLRFSRRTVIAAVEVMEGAFQIHAALTRCLLKLDSGLAARCDPGSLTHRFNHMIKYFDEEPSRRLDDGELLWDKLVEEAVSLLPPTEPEYPGQEPAYVHPTSAAFLRALERDGFTLSGGVLRRALPVDIGLPAAQSEIDRLLDKHGLVVPKGQLVQAIDAHARGNWASANGQFRPFLEGLLDEITARLDPPVREPLRGHASRAKLASIGFLRRDLNEWDDDGRGFINGLMNRLHPEGPHPGLSGDEDSTFRLHVVLLTALLLLTRFDTRGSA
jgi:hypothetical protein